VSLTPRQESVLRLIAAGCTYREAGQQSTPAIKENTVKAILRRAYDRLGVESAVEAFGALGWLTAPEHQHRWTCACGEAWRERAAIPDVRFP
jgi:DNA-binding CsgD family transcriptional regulator